MSAASRQVDSITVVGGGDAGLLTALALEKGLDDVPVTVIDDFEESVPEVGKSTLTYVPHFLHNLLEIDRKRMVGEVELAWKTTVFFEDWCGVGPFHSPLGEVLPIIERVNEQRRGQAGPQAGPHALTTDHEQGFHEYYYRHEEGEYKTLYGEIAETPGKTPLVIDDRNVTTVRKALSDAAYHFNSRGLNRFLRTICAERGIDLVNDRVSGVEVDGDAIVAIEGEVDRYEADLYVDATGFRRELMTALGNEFLEFDLPVDAAAVTTVDLDDEDIVSATVVTSGEAGWYWQIDTPGIRDLGYVYSSEYLSEEEALEEFVETRDEPIDPDDVRYYRFESGVVEQPWIGNCVATGNALGFVEPLQSTALSTTTFLATRFTQLLAKHGRVNHAGVRELYNDSTRTTWEEVYHFISIYYTYNSGTTPFWEAAKEIDPGPIDQVESYHASGFSAPEDHYRLTRIDADVNNYYLYYQILRELGVESEFYDELAFDPDPDVATEVDRYTDSLPLQTEEFLSYPEFYVSFHPGYD